MQNKYNLSYTTHRMRLTFLSLYGLSALYIFHKMLINYGNSSYIERLTSPEMIGLLYALGSAGAITVLMFSPTLFRIFDQRWLAFGIILAETTALVLVGFDITPTITIAAFVLALVLMPAVGLVIDLLAESAIGDDESTTGTRWALMLSAMSFVSIVAALTLAAVVGEDPNRLSLTYFISAVVLIVLLIVVRALFRHDKLPKPTYVKVQSSLARLWRDTDLRYAYLSRLTVSVFFGAISIYLPLYLIQVIGFSWTIIGLLIALQMSAYLLSEYAIGRLADERWGEVEMLVSGFLLSAAVMITMSFVPSSTLWLWALLFFTMGLGGSLMETTLMSYYYKHTRASDIDLIGFFRTTTPFAAGIGALTGSAILLYFSYSHIFLSLAVFLLLGIVYAQKMHDTR